MRRRKRRRRSGRDGCRAEPSPTEQRRLLAFINLSWQIARHDRQRRSVSTRSSAQSRKVRPEIGPASKRTDTTKVGKSAYFSRAPLNEEGDDVSRFYLKQILTRHLCRSFDVECADQLAIFHTIVVSAMLTAIGEFQILSAVREIRCPNIKIRADHLHIKKMSSPNRVVEFLSRDKLFLFRHLHATFRMASTQATAASARSPP